MKRCRVCGELVKGKYVHFCWECMVNGKRICKQCGKIYFLNDWPKPKICRECYYQRKTPSKPSKPEPDTFNSTESSEEDLKTMTRKTSKHCIQIQRLGNYLRMLLEGKDNYIVTAETDNKGLQKNLLIKHWNIENNKINDGPRADFSVICKTTGNVLWGEVGGCTIKKVFTIYRNEQLLWVPTSNMADCVYFDRGLSIHPINAQQALFYFIRYQKAAKNTLK